MREQPRYLIEIFWSAEDQGYVAVVPDLPGCSAVGETPEESLRQVQDAQAAWIEARRKAGEPLPPPSAAPHVALG